MPFIGVAWVAVITGKAGMVETDGLDVVVIERLEIPVVFLWLVLVW